MKQERDYVDPCTPSLNQKLKKSALSLMREESVKILRENDNLDLNTYKPFMQEFYKFSGDMFDFESNIFQAKKKDPTQMLEANLRRSLKNEYRLAEKDLKFQEGGAPSPERINKLLKKYPPF